ncbi:MAG: cyclodeaminase/cyclohydrolase family protein [Desulfobacteraceae bacterium]
MNSTKFPEMSLASFTKELAGDSPTPGGGSAAALAGCLAAALCAMVSRLTLGRDKYKDAAEKMESVKDEADKLWARLLALVDEDATAYNKVTAAFQLPKGTDEEKAARTGAIQEALKTAAAAPLETLKAAAELCRLCRLVVEEGNPNCLTDAGVSAQLIRAAAKGAAYNIKINLSSINEPDFCETLAALATELLSRTLTDVSELEEVLERALD